MRKHFLLYWLLPLAALLNVFIKVAAQQPKAWSYQYFNSSHGLASSTINALAKDDKGFLWLGTASGISRYDGYGFTNYAYSKQNDLIVNVNVIKPVKNNCLWIGAGSGLFFYENNVITKISTTTNASQAVNDILVEDNELWLATENGPAHINIKEIDFYGKKKLVITDHLITAWQQTKTLHYTRAQLISKAADGTIFIASENNLLQLSGNTLQLLHSSANFRDRITTIFPVSRSLIYFDAVSTEINKIENGISSNFNPEKLYQPATTARDSGIWYAGTRGAFCFHPSSGLVSDFFAFSDKYAVWPTAILKDVNFLWAASMDGLIKLKPSIFNYYSIKQTHTSNDYYTITELKNGSILLGANRGKIFEKKDTSFLLYKEKLVQDAEIKNIYEDERGWLWIASGYKGLVVIRNGKTENFTLNEGLHDNTLTQFLLTKNRRLYVVGDQGITEIIVNNINSISFKKFITQPVISRAAKYFAAIEAPDESIWMGGEEGITYLQNDSLKKFTLNGKQAAVNFILKDATGKVWIAIAGEGILQCKFSNNNKLEIVKQYKEEDGLNSLYYLSLLADKENNIWAASSKGLSVITQHKNNNRILNFDETDGFLKAGYSSITLKQDSHGIIWAASTFGFTSFNPATLLITVKAPPVYITAVQLNKINSAQQTLSLQATIKNKFSYDDNNLNFNYTAIDYANPAAIRYYYKLDGLDSNWINSGNLRSISFQNLSPGKYSFRVKALNSKGIWSEQDAVYSFTIIPPFWKTWWFIVCLIAAITTLFYFYIKRRERIVREKEQQNTELQSLKASSYQYQYEMTQVINYFATSIQEQNSIDDMLWDVAKNCIAKLGFEDCVIYLKNKETNVLLQKAAWGPKTNRENKILAPIEILPGHGIVGTVAITGKAEIINDTSNDSRYIVDDALRLSEITIPIISNGEVIGIIDSEHPQKNFYTERHLQILTTIASLCADKMDKIKAEQQAKEKQLEVLKLNKDLATSQLTALRAQMNPHFIFNALNSVQQYILQGNVIEANKYLSKFSKLQREILNNSTQNFIPLQKEMEMLNLYLELEQLRFAEKFTYAIEKDEAIDEEEIKIPPMIIQPFIENAIWHGLMPKTGDRFVKVIFSLPGEDQLMCTITDNGIGREAATRLRNANSNDTQHKSKGLLLVYDRLNILQAQYGKPFNATITDLTNDDGTSNGTRVTLTIYLDF